MQPFSAAELVCAQLSTYTCWQKQQDYSIMTYANIFVADTLVPT